MCDLKLKGSKDRGGWGGGARRAETARETKASLAHKESGCN